MKISEEIIEKVNLELSDLKPGVKKTKMIISDITLKHLLAYLDDLQAQGILPTKPE